MGRSWTRNVSSVGCSASGGIRPFDGRGNATQLPGDRYLRYDADGRLVQVCRWAACGQAGATTLAEYAYDPDGRRVWAKRGSEATYFFDGFDLTLTVGNPQGSGTILRHVAAGGRVVASTSVAEGNLLLAGVAPRGATPVLLARVVAGSLVLLVVGVVGLGGPHTRAGRRIGVLRVGTTLVCFLLVQLPLPPNARGCEVPTDPLPDTYFYHPDQLGSTELLTTYEGAAYEYLRHQPFGDVAAFDPEGIAKTPASTFQFTGHRGDDGTGLSYFGARYYDPALGLFVSQDPAGQFFSPYSYGSGNPLAGTDPTGAEFSLLAVFIIALLSAVATVIDAAVQGASLGDALVAGVITFGTSVAGAYLGGIVGAAVQGLGPAYAPALQAGLAAVAVGSVAYGAYESFSNGRYASGAAIFLSIGIGYALSGRGETPAAAEQERVVDEAVGETGPCSGACGNQSAHSAGRAWKRVDGIEVLRRDISLKGDDKYGHWWIEIDGKESYGWWPREPVDLKGTLFGVEGELNGQTSFGGTATLDPHHGDRGSAVSIFHVYARSGRAAAGIRDAIRGFANSYRGTWSWPCGQNCHSFQDSLLRTLDLRIRPAPLPST